MAKKVVASFQKGEVKIRTKLIRMVKSPKTGAYMFTEEMLPAEQVKEALSAKK